MSDADKISIENVNELLSSFDKDVSLSDDFLGSSTSVDGESTQIKKGYKLYNFRRPDKFSKDHLKVLQDIHKEFSRQLSMALTAYLRMHIEMEVVSADQLTYMEFVNSMPTPATVGILELSPLPGQIMIYLSHEIVTSIIDRMFGGGGLSEANIRELTDIEEALILKVLDRSTRALSQAWSNIYPISGKVINIDSNAYVQIANPSEIVALITIEIQTASKYFGLMSLCFPFPILENLLDKLSSQHIFQGQGLIGTEEDKNNIIDRLNIVNVHASVILGDTEIQMSEFLELKEGDVIKLDNKVDENLILTVNEKKKFDVRPGTLKNKVSVKVVDEHVFNE
ncbi:MAG: flagellar motor switch protein FliM [Candidatus Gastranaerophilales bacterium]|jgi:flagellar motor switch protein FliM|nr:flagellar motor switch protein FliM [Candidatus Gastranaerophilales bacterium]